jgi:hypothetical protein
MTSNQDLVSSASAELDDRSQSFTSPLSQMAPHFSGVSPEMPTQGVCTNSAWSRFCIMHSKICISEAQFPTYSRLFPGIPIYSRISGSEKEINSFSYNGLPSCGHLFQKIFSNRSHQPPPRSVPSISRFFPPIRGFLLPSLDIAPRGPQDPSKKPVFAHIRGLFPTLFGQNADSGTSHQNPSKKARNVAYCRITEEIFETILAALSPFHQKVDCALATPSPTLPSVTDSQAPGPARPVPPKNKFLCFSNTETTSLANEPLTPIFD